MAFRIIIKPLAVHDIDEPIKWYESKSKGLGKRFYHNFEEALEKIIKDPTAYFNVIPEVRRVLLKSFPYKIFYTISIGAIFILGVMHTKRSKAFVRRRLK